MKRTLALLFLGIFITSFVGCSQAGEVMETSLPSMEATAEPTLNVLSPNLGLTVNEFETAINSAFQNVGSPIRADCYNSTTSKYSTGQIGDYVTFLFTTISNDDSNIEKITFTGTGDGSEGSGAIIYVSIVMTVKALTPSIDNDTIAELVLDMLDDNHMQLEGIQYFVNKSSAGTSISITPIDKGVSELELMPEPETSSNINFELIKTDLYDRFENVALNQVNVSLEDDYNGLCVAVYLDLLELSNFGGYVYITTQYYSEILKDMGIKSIRVYCGEVSFVTYEGPLDIIGILFDGRSGEMKSVHIVSYDELANKFPRLRHVIAAEKLDPEDVKMFEEIMAILDKNTDRPDEEVFAEISPNYGMTAEELRVWMLEMIDKRY